MPTIAERRATFRSLHERGFFMLPNAWDAGSVRRLAAMGFRAIASTSSGAAWTAGKEDGELGRDAVLDHLRMLVAATDLPVNADFENAFADDPAGVASNVALAVKTGIAGVSVEDWSGERMYDVAHAAERIAAAREAIDRVDPAVMLIGRNKTFRIPGMRAAESIARAVAYADAGADCLFVPGMFDVDAVAELVSAVAPKPVSAILAAFDDSVATFASLGVRRCSTGGALAKAAWDGFTVAAERLKACEAAAIG